MEDNALLTIDQAAAALQVSRSTIYRWLAMGRLKPVHLGPAYKLHRPVRIWRSEVDALRQVSE